MDDSDSGVGSVSSIISTRTTSSMSGDDRSAAGSRSSAASLSLSEVSSPAPQQQTPSSAATSALHQESIRVWRDLDQANQLRHIPLTHLPLMMTPSGHAAGPHYPLHMPYMLPPPIAYGTDPWPKQPSAGQSRYDDEKLTRDRREMEYREMERQKDLERERERVERQQQAVAQQQQQQHQQQLQQQHEQRERERQSQKQQTQTTDHVKLVAKHFEESFRRANEKKQQYMQPVWTLNTIPSHQPPPTHISHLGQQSHVPSSQQQAQQQGQQQREHPSVNASSPAAVAAAVAQHQQLEDRRRIQQQQEREHDRIYADREREREQLEKEREQRERLRDNERERDRQMRQHEQHQRAFYAAAANIPQRSQSKVDYQTSSQHSPNPSPQQQQQLRGISMSVSQQQQQQQQHQQQQHSKSSSSSSNEKQQIIPENSSGGQQQQQRILMDGGYKTSYYNSYPSHHPSIQQQQQQQSTNSQSSSSPLSFHKDLSKSKNDLSNSLPNPPPLMSDIKQSAGVIVKHDTIKSSPSVQMVQHTSSVSSKQSAPSSHYPQPKVGMQHGRPPYEYMLQSSQAPPSQVADRYKGSAVTVMPSSQNYHLQQSQTPPSQQQQQVVQQQQQHYRSNSPAANKSKVPAPAPSHFYQKPSSAAGIVSGIPVCRPSDIPVFVAKSSSPSPFQSHQSQLYSGPPPAHSRNAHDYRIHQQPNVVVGGPTGIGKSHSIVHHPLHPSHSHHSASPPTQIPVGVVPPLAASHVLSSRSPSLIQVPNVIGTPPLTNPLILSAAGQSFQTQPLDLGVSSREDSSSSNGSGIGGAPKRKGTPIHHPIGSPVALDVKKKKIDMGQLQNSPIELKTTALPSATSPHVTASTTTVVSQPPLNSGIELNLTKTTTTELISNTTTNQVPLPHHPPQQLQQQQPIALAKSPLALTTTDEHHHHLQHLHHQSHHQQLQQQQTVNLTMSAIRNDNSDNDQSTSTLNNRLSSTNSSPSQSPGVLIGGAASSSTTSNSSHTSYPITPAKSETSDKSSSPAPKSAPTSGGPRHLKKAWLQRHTGEDFEDTTGVTGGGSCVKLPLTIATINNATPAAAAASNPPVHSLHTVGSMAVNSISKIKPGAGSVNNKVSTTPLHPKKSLANQNHNFAGGKESNNGQNHSDSDVEENSSSSEDRTSKNSTKRKPAKGNKRKGGPAARKPQDDLKKKKVVPAISESDKESDSDRDSLSDKDSDSGTSTSQGTNKKTSNGGSRSNVHDISTGVGGKEPRKRGRRPKTKDDVVKKKTKETVSVHHTKDPFRKPTISQLKKSGDSFLQDGPCFEVAPKLAKCRECRWTPNQRSKNTPNIFCRFYAFRRLRYTKNGQLAMAGFSDPHKDPADEDLKLWTPDADNPPTDLDLYQSRFLLSQVADQFCDLLQQEHEAMAEHMNDDKTIAWKRVVQGVREMCDVCETTLFNFHWACSKCGFVVCIDCYKDRKSGIVKIWNESGKDRDDNSWLLCTNRASHEQDKLMLTQIIAGDSLQTLGKQTHEIRALWEIPQYCGCVASTETPKVTNGYTFRKEFVRNLIKRDESSDTKLTNGDGSIKGEPENITALSWLADVALQNETEKNGRNDENKPVKSENDDTINPGGQQQLQQQLDSNDPTKSSSTLRELLIRPSANNNNNGATVAVGGGITGGGGVVVGGKPNGSQQTIVDSPLVKKKKSLEGGVVDEQQITDPLNTTSPIKVEIKEEQPMIDAEEKLEQPKHVELKHFIGRTRKLKQELPVRIMTVNMSNVYYPNVPHSWLCDGKLLRLHDPSHPGNYKIFQDQWKRGQPVVVSDVAKNLSMDLWHPESFIRDFGDEKNDLVNCINGNILPNQSMRKFWEGFEHITKRMKDDKGNPMLLKLKDWPPGEDFAELMPTRFNDLIKCLPLGEYTQRNGRLNLASRLPDCFVRPDLGPKMYNAYGSAVLSSKGTTNLHLDISDAVNVMVYIGIPKDGPDESYLKTEAYKAIDEAGCDIMMRRRVRDKNETVGAIWHIYASKDADKIRDLLNKVAIERGERLEPNHDPIHDQSWYLDQTLRERLFKDYGVEGYPIAQCLGDAVFIPAGAPHQVRNLHNCIKVAEDFVSPENIYHCFHLTHEFRVLSDTHSNHEDKLQIKNIIYHAVKDAIASLTHILGQKIAEAQALDHLNAANNKITTTSTNTITIKKEIKEECDNKDSTSVTKEIIN